MTTNSGMYSDSDNVYLNLSITNNLTSNGGGTIDQRSIRASLSVNKTIPIIDKPSDYYLTVVRFAMPLNTIPLMICPIIPNQGNSNLTPLKVGIFYNGTYYTQSVIYIPQNNEIVPLQNQISQVISPYYFMYSYDQFVTYVNTALSASWVASGLAALFPAISAPYFYYNGTTQLISLVVPNCFITLTAPAISIPTLYVNHYTYKYFGTFNVTSNGDNQINGNDHNFVFRPTQNNILNVNQYNFYQDFQTVSSWSNLNTIIISSPTLPIVQESVPSNNVNSNIGNTITNSFPILTDFVPNIELPGQSVSTAYYYPQGPYRLINMVTDIPVSNITINLFWTDLSGNLYPLMLDIGKSINIKLAFLKKSLYKQSANKILSYN